MKNSPTLTNEKTITVNKFGGVNVSQMKEILDTVKILQKQNEAPVLVLSAFKGITDKLIKGMDQLNETDYKESDIDQAFQSVTDETNSKIEKFIETDKKQKEAKERVGSLFEICKEALITHKKITTTLNPQTNTFKIRDTIIGFGEISVIEVMEVFLNENGINAKAVNNIEYLNGDDDGKDKPLSHQVLHKNIQRGIAEKTQEFKDTIQEQVLIFGGFIKNIPDGIIQKIGRSYSDTTAVDATCALNEIDIPVEKTVFWKDVDGFLTANPKDLDKDFNTPKKHTDISLEEALEAATSGSMLLHTSALTLAARFGVNLNLKNINNPQDEGTHYHSNEIVTNLPFKAVIANHDVDSITVTLPEMATESGFFSAITNVFKKHDININENLSSGTSVTYTIPLPPDEADQKAERIKLRKATNDLRKLTVGNEEFDCNVQWNKKRYANVSIIGEELKDQIGIDMLIKSVIAAHGISNAGGVQDFKQRKISFYVSNEEGKRAVQVLHGFFIDKDPQIIETVEKYYQKKINQFKD